MAPQQRLLAVLAPSQILSWGILYYSITILGPAIARESGWGVTSVVGAYSWSLVLAGLVATPAGAWLDRTGGRRVMACGSVLGACGMALLAASHHYAVYLLAWTVLGVAMALNLYEAAFATLNRELGLAARKAISTLSLFGGFASTAFWPLTMHLQAALGWRATCLVYAGVMGLVCLPLHLCLPARAPAVRTGAAAALPHAGGDATLGEAMRHPAFWKLAFAFAANVLVFAAMAVHLIPMLTHAGYAPALAVTLAALIGPAQVAGRIAERLFFHEAPPQLIGRAAFAALPCGLLAVVLLLERAPAAGLFCVLLGASNGVLTIVRGALPQQLFGRTHYGAIAGALAAPSIAARAAGPLLAAALLEAGLSAQGLLALFLLLACLSTLCFVQAVRRQPAPLAG